MMEKSQALKSLYSQRERFILIGLTGRTGSGCTTVANILAKESMDELDLRSYKTCDYNNSDERKYSVIYRFMKEGKKWKKFSIIEASSIILSFVLENKFKDLFLFLDELEKEGEIKDLDSIKKKMVVALTGSDFCWQNIKLKEFADKNIDEFLFNIKKGNWLKKRKLEVNKDETNEKIKEIINYFTIDLKKKKNDLRNVLKNNSFEKHGGKNTESQIYDLYSYFMQVLGNNIRSSGKYNSDKEIAGKEITVAERINDLIKLMNFYEENKDEKAETIRICIDALRNSVEIQYFRDRYRAFYAFAVNTENEYRQNRLELNKKEMKSLDKIEYPDDNTVFYHQNIQACLEISDIYLYNPNVTNNKYYELSEQILKYIALILHPGLIAPTHLERCMQLAFNAKYNSGCLSRQVGAVVTGDDFSVRAVGWNDVPKGQVPCNLRCVEDYCKNKDSETFSEFELNDSVFDEAMKIINGKSVNVREQKAGRCFAYCFKDVYNGITNQKNQVYTRALHAEENAFLQISKYGGAEIQGGKLFTTASPCELCSKKAYQLGIREIYYIDPYPGISRSHILTFGKTGNPKMILFQGAIGNAYISLYAPKMPYKDEIGLATGISVKGEAKKVYEKHKDDKE